MDAQKQKPGVQCKTSAFSDVQVFLLLQAVNDSAWHPKPISRNTPSTAAANTNEHGGVEGLEPPWI